MPEKTYNKHKNSSLSIPMYDQEIKYTVDITMSLDCPSVAKELNYKSRCVEGREADQR